MYQQSILDALTDVGFNQMDWSQIGGLTSENIANQFASHYGLGEEDLVSGMFQQITPEMLQGASYKTYAPQIQAKGQSMLSDLYKNLGGQAATRAAGGFAASSGFGKQQAGIRDVYGKGMTDTLSNVMQQQSQGMSNISNLISQWHEMAQNIAS